MDESYWRKLPEGQKVYEAQQIDLAETPDEDRVMLRFSSPNKDEVFVSFPSFDHLYQHVENVYRKLHQKKLGRRT